MQYEKTLIRRGTPERSKFFFSVSMSTSASASVIWGCCTSCCSSEPTHNGISHAAHPMFHASITMHPSCHQAEDMSWGRLSEIDRLPACMHMAHMDVADRSSC